MTVRKHDPKNIPIIETGDRIEELMPHNLTLKPDLKFTGYQLVRPVMLKTTHNGGVIANKWDWIIICPDGSIMRLPDRSFRIMFETKLKINAAGRRCRDINCDGVYSKVGGEMRCNKCGDKYV